MTARIAAPTAALLVAALTVAPAWGRPAPPEAADEAGAQLEPVPRPVLDHFETADQEQLRAAREELDRLIDAQARPEALAHAYGRLGQLYFLYDLMAAAEPALENALSLASEGTSEKASAPDPEALDTFRWHYTLGVLHFREGRSEAAVESLERARRLRPDDLPTLLRLGRLALSADRPDDARERFEAALEVDPASAAALAGLGRIAAEQDRPQEAAERFERALEIQPEANALHHQLGMAYRDLGDMDRAREHLALNRGDTVSFPDPLIDGLAGFLQGADVHLKRGNWALEAGDLERALAEYRIAADKAPEDPLARFNIGVALLRRGERDEALKHFRQAIELDPDFRNARYNLAATLAEAGRWDEAVEHYERAYRIDPLDHEAHLDWAVALARAGRPERAAEELRAVLEEAPDNLPTLKARGRLELAGLALAAGRPEEALEHRRIAVQLAPELREARLALARLLARGGRFGEAATQYEAAIELEPSDVQARFGRAMALLLGDETARARRVLEEDLAVLEALEASAEVVPLAHVLARLLATAEDAEVRDGERALDLAFRVFRADRKLGHAETVAMALAETGQFDRAVAWQRKILEQADGMGRPDLTRRARERLALYQEGRPVREPWRGDGP